LGFSNNIFSQQNIIDSLQAALTKQHQDTSRAILLYKLSYFYQTYKPDSSLLLAQEAYDLSVKHHFLKGESNALYQIAGAFAFMGNSTQALEYYIRQLKIEEERNQPDEIANINMNIALVYNRNKDTAKAIAYILTADSILRANHSNDLELQQLLNLNKGDIFEKANRLPEALLYTQNCYQFAIKNDDSLMIGSALNNLGNIYSKAKDFEKAIGSYRSSMPYLAAMNDNQSLSEGKIGMSKAFEQKGIADSALLYANGAYKLAYQNGFLSNALASATQVSQLYKKQHNTDSAFTYLEIAGTLKDSIEGIEKIKRLESISIEEQLRQKHLLALAEEEKEETRQRLQLLAIGIMIPVFFLTSIYISRKKINRKLIEFSGIVSLLLLFEYITLLIHPFVEEITHHTPLLEIIILVCIAALVVPAHHKIESWLIKRLGLIHEKHSHPAPEVAEETVEAMTAEDSLQTIIPVTNAANENAHPEENTGQAL
jgi:hypothetical protein